MKFNLRRLRAERVAKGLTQAELASKIGISRSAYVLKENGDRDIGIDEFTRILDALGFTKDQLPLFFDKSVHKKEH